MFVNTHWGLILCTLYMLRTVCLLLCFPVHSFSLSQGLRWNCSSCLCLFLITLYSPRTFYPVVSRNTHPKLTAVSPPPSSSASSFAIVSSLQTLIRCDTMHHGPVTLHGLCPSDTLFKALLRVRFEGPHKRYPKAKIQIFNFWQMQIPKISLCPVSFSVLLSLPPCSMCIKRQTQHWL